MEFAKLNCWSGLPCSPPGDLPDTGNEPGSPALQADSSPLSHQGSPILLLPQSKSSQVWDELLWKPAAGPCYIGCKFDSHYIDSKASFQFATLENSPPNFSLIIVQVFHYTIRDENMELTPLWG